VIPLIVGKTLCEGNDDDKGLTVDKGLTIGDSFNYWQNFCRLLLMRLFLIYWQSFLWEVIYREKVPFTHFKKHYYKNLNGGEHFTFPEAGISDRLQWKVTVNQETTAAVK
jgi:hypothetical protein